jgi:hypothetical protein
VPVPWLGCSLAQPVLPQRCHEEDVEVGQDFSKSKLRSIGSGGHKRHLLLRLLSIGSLGPQWSCWLLLGKIQRVAGAGPWLCKLPLCCV